MQLLDIVEAGIDYEYTWPNGNREPFARWVEYRAAAPDGERTVRIGFGHRATYGRDRRRVVVWIDGHPQVEFVGADDFDRSGDVLAELKVPGERGERICRYPDEAVPERYAALPIVGLPTRLTGPYLHAAWAVVANIADHRTLAAVAALRRLERRR
jgi:hypothetical protein